MFDTRNCVYTDQNQADYTVISNTMAQEAIVNQRVDDHNKGNPEADIVPYRNLDQAFHNW